jgi:SHS2 domain-containing protein
VSDSEELEVEARDLPGLLHDFMDEVLFRFSTGRVAVEFRRMKVSRGSPCRLWVEAGFVEYSRRVHGQGSEVKAVTLSNLRVGERRPFDAFVVLDI